MPILRQRAGPFEAISRFAKSGPEVIIASVTCRVGTARQPLGAAFDRRACNNGPSCRDQSVSDAMKAMLLLLSISSAALADDAAMLRCRGIADTSARLACYDAIVVLTSDEKARQSEAVQREQFGLGKPAAGTPDLEAIESTIPGHFEGWEAGSSIRLANGQVWQISDNSRGIHYIDNPKVRIRRGVLTAHYLEIEGTNRSPRVIRVQ